MGQYKFNSYGIPKSKKDIENSNFLSLIYSNFMDHADVILVI